MIISPHWFVLIHPLKLFFNVSLLSSMYLEHYFVMLCSYRFVLVQSLSLLFKILHSHTIKCSIMLSFSVGFTSAMLICLMKASDEPLSLVHTLEPRPRPRPRPLPLVPRPLWVLLMPLPLTGPSRSPNDLAYGWRTSLTLISLIWKTLNLLNPLFLISFLQFLLSLSMVYQGFQDKVGCAQRLI